MWRVVSHTDNHTDASMHRIAALTGWAGHLGPHTCVLQMLLFLRGTAPPTPKLACFVLYLKITNILLKNNTRIL